jgi:hypothetical protein
MHTCNKVVYLHRDKEGVVRYVGSGTTHRAFLTSANSDRGARYAEFVEANGNLAVEIIAEGLCKLSAENLEREMFDQHKDTILNQRRPSSSRIMEREMFDDYLFYDETSLSCLRWKVNVASWVKVGSAAGSLDNKGYYIIKLKGIPYKAHRIIAVLHNLDINGFLIDHIDRDRANNKISNLRVVNPKENNQNSNSKKLSSTNTSGVQGVSYDKTWNRWIASWYENGQRKLKYFPINSSTSSEYAFGLAVEYRKKISEIQSNET